MGIFEESDKIFSMRRVLAFLFALVSVIAGLMCIEKGESWQAIAVAFGIPALTSILLMFFTTWQDVARVAASFHTGNKV